MKQVIVVIQTSLYVALLATPLPAFAQFEGIPAECFKIRMTGQNAYEQYLKCIVSSLEPMDPKRRHWYGERYDPQKYFECRKDLDVADMSCEEYRLKRRPEPEYWPNAGKAPPVKWPEAPKQNVYRKGMKPKEYFDALCKAEAGEFIYRTVENVEGVYQIRPRLQASSYELRDRYVMEDPYGYTEWEATEPARMFVSPGRHALMFFERPKVHPVTRQWIDQTIEHHSGYVSRREGFKLVERPMLIEEYPQTKSRYGFTWRGIKRPFDREHGIAGGELIVVDLKTNEILGIRRGFIQSDIKNRDYKVNWENLTVCPILTDRHGWPKDFDFTTWFVSKVLKPVISRGNTVEVRDGTK